MYVVTVNPYINTNIFLRTIISLSHVMPNTIPTQLFRSLGRWNFSRHPIKWGPLGIIHSTSFYSKQQESISRCQVRINITTDAMHPNGCRASEERVALVQYSSFSRIGSSWIFLYLLNVKPTPCWIRFYSENPTLQVKVPATLVPAELALQARLLSSGLQFSQNPDTVALVMDL